jgi:outer membrane protein with beta-barrel domain
MKRTPTIIVLALFLCLPPVAARAQGSLGLKGGASFGNVTNRGILPGTLSDRTGFAIGLSAGASQSLFGFGIEGLYAQRGVTSSTAATESRSLDYVDVPAYLRVMIPMGGAAPFAYAGPQASFELRCRSGDVACPDTDRPKTTYAYVVGAGARLGGKTAFSLEGRYIYGLTDLKLSTITSSASYKTRSFLILAGVGF